MPHEFHQMIFEVYFMLELSFYFSSFDDLSSCFVVVTDTIRCLL